MQMEAPRANVGRIEGDGDQFDGVDRRSVQRGARSDGMKAARVAEKRNCAYEERIEA